MLTRRDLLSKALDDCMKDIYSFVQPSVDWDTFVEENKIYSNKFKVWERYKYLDNKENKSEKELEEYSTYPIAKWKNKPIKECIGPRPYEFYYIPKEIMKDIVDLYVSIYKMDSKQELLDTISILKKYCEAPIVDKYISDYTDEHGNHHPGHRDYDHPDNLEKELYKLLREKAGFSITNGAIENLTKEVLNKFFEFLDMAGNFYDWNGELNSFGMSVYLGCSPNSNKEAVIENWKEYRNQDIEINEEQIKKDYYGEED